MPLVFSRQYNLCFPGNERDDFFIADIKRIGASRNNAQCEFTAVLAVSGPAGHFSISVDIGLGHHRYVIHFTFNHIKPSLKQYND